MLRLVLLPLQSSEPRSREPVLSLVRSFSNSLIGTPMFGNPLKELSRAWASVGTLSSRSYREAFQRLVDLHNSRSDLERRRELLKRLETVAPAWAAAIRDRCGHHG